MPPKQTWQERRSSLVDAMPKSIDGFRAADDIANARQVYDRQIVDAPAVEELVVVGRKGHWYDPLVHATRPVANFFNPAPRLDALSVARDAVSGKISPDEADRRNPDWRYVAESQPDHQAGMPPQPADSGLTQGLDYLDQGYGAGLDGMKNGAQLAGMSEDAVKAGAHVPNGIGYAIKAASFTAQVEDVVRRTGMPRDEAMALVASQIAPGAAGTAAGAVVGQAVVPTGGGIVGAATLGSLLDSQFSDSSGRLGLGLYRGYKNQVEKDPYAISRLLRYPI